MAALSSSAAAATARACGAHQPAVAASPARPPARVPADGCASSAAAALRHSIKYLGGKRRAFFLDMNAFCYEGSHLRLGSFARRVDVYSDKIKKLLQSPPEHGRIQFHRLNIKNDSRLEGLIKMSDLIRLSAGKIKHLFENDSRLEGLIKISDLVEYCSENSSRLIHFSSCKVYGKAFGSFLPKDHPLPQ